MNDVGIDGLKGCTGRRSKSIADVSVSGTLFDDIRLLRLEICFWDSSPLSSPPPLHKHTMRTSARVELVGFDAANASRPMVPQSISPRWDESSRAQAAQWYENCLNNHKTCNLEVGNRDYRPSRLLDLNDSTGSKLVETRETVVKDPYVTLSHCWGGKVPLRLLETNIQDLKKEIPVDRLPKTFLEAIEVARRLQFRYLWIDSLCIVQDSEADWRHESTSMAEVYSNASLNISATASRNGNGGLFPSYPFQFVADAWWTEDRHVTTHFIARKSWNKAIDEINLAPLSRRGWVLQERLLSPRVLHFAQKQMFWECEEVIYSQAFPAELCTSATSFEPLTKMSNKTRMLQSFNGAAYTHGSAEANEIYKSWEAWVEHYSAAAITKSSDKLVAISAVAKILGRVLNDTYVAGLWRGDMPRSLMWKRKPFRGPPVKRLEGKRAPTWSWAALDCLVDFEECLERDLMSADSLELMQLIEIQEGLSKLQHGYDEAGRLIGGELRLRGGLYQVRIPTE
ncbi:hypothetical protein E8E14_003782 [Neopestalotiopsis sp. 37M]|nr:hypothetical protein E8E14_003782 [Neopestalotiopsis sp. 37M]